MHLPYNEYLGLRWGTSSLGGKLRHGFRVEECPHCHVNGLVPTNETWNHQCQEKHRLVWISATRAACTGCDVVRGRPRVNGRYQSGHTVKALWKAAHTPKWSVIPTGVNADLVKDKAD